jgi:hypothetical protein
MIVPQRADAALIQCPDSSDPSCVLIAEFAWSFDGLFDTLTLNNRSNLAGLPGDFTNASVLFDDGLGASETGFFTPDPIGAGDTGETFPLLILPALATVSFTFEGTAFTATLSFDDLTFDALVGNDFAAVPLFAQQVPEPAIVLLLSAASAAALLRRRHVKASVR